jgi:type IV secretory pathway VirB2 component (pilin)
VSLLGGLLTIALLGLVLKAALSSGRSFSVTQAMQPVHSLTGPVAGRLLSLLTIVTVGTTTDVARMWVIHDSAVPAILAVAFGAVVAPSVTDRMLALLGSRARVRNHSRTLRRGDRFDGSCHCTPRDLVDRPAPWLHKALRTASTHPLVDCRSTGRPTPRRAR